MPQKQRRYNRFSNPGIRTSDKYDFCHSNRHFNSAAKICASTQVAPVLVK
jgi:hypothetical protein